MPTTPPVAAQARALGLDFIQLSLSVLVGKIDARDDGRNVAPARICEAFDPQSLADRAVTHGLDVHSLANRESSGMLGVLLG
jgi:hypothetical protein